MDASEDAEQFFETAATTAETSSQWIGTSLCFLLTPQINRP